MVSFDLYAGKVLDYFSSFRKLLLERTSWQKELNGCCNRISWQVQCLKDNSKNFWLRKEGVKILCRFTLEQETWWFWNKTKKQWSETMFMISSTAVALPLHENCSELHNLTIDKKLTDAENSWPFFWNQPPHFKSLYSTHSFEVILYFLVFLFSLILSLLVIFQ